MLVIIELNSSIQIKPGTSNRIHSERSKNKKIKYSTNMANPWMLNKLNAADRLILKNFEL
jgi:hypothetical protein